MNSSWINDGFVVVCFVFKGFYNFSIVCVFSCIEVIYYFFFIWCFKIIIVVFEKAFLVFYIICYLILYVKDWRFVRGFGVIFNIWFS